MTRIALLLVTVLLVSFTAGAEQPLIEVEPEFVEKQLRSKKGVERWVIDHEGTNLKSFRASRIIDLEDPYAFLVVALDYDVMSRWMHMMNHSETLLVVSNTEKHGRMISSVPWPFMDREAIAIGKLLPQKDDRTVEVYYESASDILPPNDDFLRVPEFIGRISLELLEGQKAKLTMEATVDPGGNIPKFIVHMMMRDVPYYSLIKMERLMRTDDYLGRKNDFPGVQLPDKW